MQLVAEERSGSGKGFNRKLRAKGRIPAVVYGRGKATRAVDARPRRAPEAAHSRRTSASTR